MRLVTIGFLTALSCMAQTITVPVKGQEVNLTLAEANALIASLANQIHCAMNKCEPVGAEPNRHPQYEARAAGFAAVKIEQPKPSRENHCYQDGRDSYSCGPTVIIPIAADGRCVPGSYGSKGKRLYGCNARGQWRKLDKKIKAADLKPMPTPGETGFGQ